VTRLINIADRESDIYEWFHVATREAGGPDLLIRANRSSQRKVEAEEEQRLLWAHLSALPLAGHIDLHIPGRGGRKARQAELEIRHAEIRLQPPKRMKAEPITQWAVHAFKPHPPEGSEAVEWLLLTTVPTLDWRILYLTKLGRETPEAPCSPFFEEAEWKALYCYVNKTPTPPDEPPPLGRCHALRGQAGRLPRT